MNLELASREELKRLSGRERPSAICRWLDRQRIPYIPNADGWPQVLRSALLDPGRATPQTSEPEVHPV